MKKSIPVLVITTFFSAIIIGTLLLMLPFSTVGGNIRIENALFTSASAVTVTGLTVMDTASDFTFFGKLIILLLLQLGGLGFMTFSTLILLLIGKSISFTDKFAIETDFTTGSYKNVISLVKKIFILTVSFELVGTLLLFLQFPNLPTSKRLFASIFNSISAFCNAGFSVFSNSFEDYTASVGINLTLCILIICGGIGFLVLNELSFFIRGKIKRFSKFSLHTKLVLTTTSILILLGSSIILVEEVLNKNSVLPFHSNALVALFQSVTARTAGFNTINLNLLSSASVLILLILMFIGASPGSTGGGVKTTSAGMVMAYFRSRLKGKDRVDLFYRTIPSQSVEKAFIVIILSILLIAIAFLLLLTSEKQLKLQDLLFETVSAFGTVGLSMGITPQLSLFSKLVIIVTMFIGRIGPLTLLAALSKKEAKGIYNYPEENVMIG